MRIHLLLKSIMATAMKLATITLPDDLEEVT
jgi:hypothetical protein